MCEVFFSSDFNLLVLIGLTVVIQALGFRLVKKDALENKQSQEPPIVEPVPFQTADRDKIIHTAIDSPPFVSVLTPELRNNLRRGIQAPQSEAPAFAAAPTVTMLVHARLR